MTQRARRRIMIATLLVAGACARDDRLGPPETFSWMAQPVTFSPPPPEWRREGENGGGLLGIRFVLTGGLGECITVAGYRSLAERDRDDALERLIARHDSLSQNEFLREVSLARARTDDPTSDREADQARAINAALDRAVTEYLGGRMGYADQNLREALEAARVYELTLSEALPRIRLHPEQMREPWRWRIAYERDTTIAGRPAFASDDTLITDDRPMLYRQIFWVVNGCAFQATYQGTPPNLPVFQRLVGTIQFPPAPESPRVASR